MRRAFAVHSRGSWPESEAVDAVTLAYLDRHRRRIRLVGDAGAAFLLDLPRVHRLADGDGLELDEGGFIRVHAAAEPVLEIAADDPAGLLRLAWQLGNRHLPVQVADDRLRIRADPVIAGLVTGLGGRLTPIEAAFEPEAGADAEAKKAEPSSRDAEGAVAISTESSSIEIASRSLSSGGASRRPGGSQ